MEQSNNIGIDISDVKDWTCWIRWEADGTFYAVTRMIVAPSAAPNFRSAA
jgi:hypothetical protein